MIGKVLPEDFVDEVGTSIAYNYLGIPKRGKITSWNILLACFESADRHGRASTHLDT